MEQSIELDDLYLHRHQFGRQNCRDLNTESLDLQSADITRNLELSEEWKGKNIPTKVINGFLKAEKFEKFGMARNKFVANKILLDDFF